MPKQTYIPTEADRLTGENVRRLRRLAGETLQQTIDRSGINLRQSSLSRVELGQRQLTVPEATKLAAHWNTTVEKVFGRTPEQHAEANAHLWRGTPPEPIAEQEWLGNDKPGLHAVPEGASSMASKTRQALPPRTLEINLDAPLSLADYRDQVWIPYLENRYTADMKAS